jgi:1,6-anhydro-N-acetylmuramate kinase
MILPYDSGKKNTKNVVKQMDNYYIGLMSGTSLDGVDCVIVDENIKLQNYHYLPILKNSKKNIDFSMFLMLNGGVDNNFLIERIEYLYPNNKVGTTDDLGVNPDCLEVMAFAYFVKKTINNRLLKTTNNKQQILGVVPQSHSDIIT